MHRGSCPGLLGLAHRGGAIQGMSSPPKPLSFRSDLTQKYNPELQKRSLENRVQKQQDFDNFVTKLKEYSKSDKPIWAAAAEDEARMRANTAEEQRRIAEEIQKRRDEIKRHSVSAE